MLLQASKGGGAGLGRGNQIIIYFWVFGLIPLDIQIL